MSNMDIANYFILLGTYFVYMFIAVVTLLTYLDEHDKRK